jgi:hypothetical protein
MRVRSIVAAVAALAAVLVLAPGTAGAGAPQNVITATGVGLNESSNCSGTRLQVTGSATGGQPPGEAEERGTGSSLLDPDLESFAQDSFSYGAGPFDHSYGVPIGGAPQPAGTVIGLYAAVGDVDLDPLTYGEWFVLYRCADDGNNSELLYSCFGPLGDCPANAGDAQELLFDVSADTATPLAGDTVTATAVECFGDEVDFQLVDDSTDLDTVEGVVPVGDEATAELTVPASVAPGTELTVFAECLEDGTPLAAAEFGLVVGGQVTTTTVAPPTTAASPPAARPIALAPSFTG